MGTCENRGKANCLNPDVTLALFLVDGFPFNTSPKSQRTGDERRRQAQP